MARTKEKRLKKEQRRIVVSVLATSAYFSLDSVFILRCQMKFRLIVYHQKRILVDMIYRTLKGARVAFRKFYSYRVEDFIIKVLKEQRRPLIFWGPFVEPGKAWFKQFKGLNINGWQS